ncbi:unnamed protein product, partial [Amoebophrya sp. A25]
VPSWDDTSSCSTSHISALSPGCCASLHEQRQIYNASPGAASSTWSTAFAPSPPWSPSLEQQLGYSQGGTSGPGPGLQHTGVAPGGVVPVRVGSPAAIGGGCISYPSIAFPLGNSTTCYTTPLVQGAVGDCFNYTQYHDTPTTIQPTSCTRGGFLGYPQDQQHFPTPLTGEGGLPNHYPIPSSPARVASPVEQLQLLKQ